MESMACRIANIVPEYSALGEWARGGVYYTEISDIPFYNTKGVNTRAGVVDMKSTIRALEYLYKNEADRNRIAKAGYDLVTQPQFTWQSVGKEFERVFNTATKIDRNTDE